ncbi:hypothetical protein Tco_1373991, partial [Tanacetum coccineum]
WEDGDDSCVYNVYMLAQCNHDFAQRDGQYTVDEFPLYDSAEDEPLDKVNKITDTTMQEEVNKITDTTMVVSEILLTLSNGASCMQEASRTVKTEIAGVNNRIGNNDKASFSESAGAATVGNDKCEVQEKKNGGQYAMVVSGPSAIGEFNNGTGTASAKRGAKRTPSRKQKLSGRKQINGKRVAQLFASKKVQDELIQCESNWLSEASCSKYKADLNLYFAVVKNVICPPVTNEPNPGPENSSF